MKTKIFIIMISIFFLFVIDAFAGSKKNYYCDKIIYKLDGTSECVKYPPLNARDRRILEYHNSYRGRRLFRNHNRKDLPEVFTKKEEVGSLLYWIKKKSNGS